MNWFDLVPSDVAARQIWWERAQQARRMRQAGLSFTQIARRLNRSTSRAGQLVIFANQRPISPVEIWFRHGGEIAALSERLRKRRQ
jgi:hypothetical protein